MGYLVRKFNRAKWCEDGFELGAPVSADAVTSCLRTQGNTLSFWLIDDLKDTDQAALAIAAGGTQLDTMDVIWLPEGCFEEAGLEVAVTEGGSRCNDLNSTHRDVVNLDVHKLAIVSQIVARYVLEDWCDRYIKSDIASLIAEAVRVGRIAEKSLPDKIVKEVDKVRARS